MPVIPIPRVAGEDQPAFVQYPLDLTDALGDGDPGVKPQIHRCLLVADTIVAIVLELLRRSFHDNRIELQSHLIGKIRNMAIAPREIVNPCLRLFQGVHCRTCHVLDVKQRTVLLTAKDTDPALSMSPESESVHYQVEPHSREVVREPVESAKMIAFLFSRYASAASFVLA